MGSNWPQSLWGIWAQDDMSRHCLLAMLCSWYSAQLISMDMRYMKLRQPSEERKMASFSSWGCFWMFTLYCYYCSQITLWFWLVAELPFFQIQELRLCKIGVISWASRLNLGLDLLGSSFLLLGNLADPNKKELHEPLWARLRTEPNCSQFIEVGEHKQTKVWECAHVWVPTPCGGSPGPPLYISSPNWWLPNAYLQTLHWSLDSYIYLLMIYKL